MESPFFSIIIPIYKVEKYLRQCVDSVICQTYKDFEIILVDDGSPDSCPVICDEYSNRYENIHVVHKKNGGSSSARNAGIIQAKGEYVLFIDADDYWNDTNALEQILKRIEYTKADLIMWTSLIKYNQVTGNFAEVKKNTVEAYLGRSTAEFYENLVSHGNLEISACFKAIKRIILINNNVYFPEGKTTEDVLFSIQLFEYVENAAIFDCPFYVYRTCREGSITNSISKQSIISYIDIISECLKVVNEGKPELKMALMSYLAYHYLLICAHIGKSIKKEERKQFYPQLERLASTGLMKYRLHPKVKTLGPVYDIGGYRALIMLLGIALKYFYK